MSQKLFIVSELFYPDLTSTAYIMTEISRALARETPVTVICGPDDHRSLNKEKVSSLPSNLTVYRVSAGNWNKDRLITRVIRFIILSVSLAKAIARKTKRGDKLFIVTNPAPLLILASAISRWKNLDLIILVHDVFPENLVPAGISSGRLISRVTKRIFNHAYSRASRLIVLGRDMKKLMAKKIGEELNTSKISVVENWADVESIYPLSSARPEGVVKLQFAGNFGRVQGLLELLNCIHLANNSEMLVEFIGTGALEQEMKQYCLDHKIETVRIHPPFNRADQLTVLNSCDIGIVSLAKGMGGLGVPSKTYNLLAAGKPILYIGDEDSEIFKLVEEEQIGWTFSGYNEELVEFLRYLSREARKEIEIKGQRSREVALKRFSKEKILAEYCLVILS